MRAATASLIALVLALAGSTALQSQVVSFEQRSGEEIYGAACAACHGADGQGRPTSVVGFDTPLPDFTDCSFATPETDLDWLAIAHEGGPIRAFDRRMPAFGGALSEAAILRAIEHVRSFCDSTAWPRGELNLPRALVTEKAFPENETVLSVSMAGGDDAAVATRLIYERRIGSRTQVELVAPVEMAKNGNGWHRGIGDAAVAAKHVLFHSLDQGTILSAGGEVSLPTATGGVGKGVAVVEPFLALGQILPSDGFVQVHGGWELSANRSRAGAEAFVRTAVGKSFMSGRFGRTWSPMIELIGARELEPDTTMEWDLVPQAQVTLSKRQHVMIDAGVRIPVNRRAERGIAVLTYLLWDWFDGGFFDGWR